MKVVIPGERSDPAGGTVPFRLQVSWMPDRVRHDGLNQDLKEKFGFFFVI